MLRRPTSLLALVLSAFVAANAHAAQRTFVASSGNDANPCTIVLPCRAFAAAMSAVAYGGEVIVLDSAGYGPVTITRSVSIIAPPGVYAGITVVLPAQNGIVVNGFAVAVLIRGLTLNGQSGGPDIHSGIYFTQGAKLTVEDSEISGFPLSAIWVEAAGSQVFVKNTVLHETGDSCGGGFAAYGSVTAVLDGVRSYNNGCGVGAFNGAHVMVTNSVLSNNSAAGVSAAGSGITTEVFVTHTTIAGSNIGVLVDAGPTGTVNVVSDGNSITDVPGGAFNFVGGGGSENVYTSGNNVVSKNSPVAVGGVLTSIGQH